MKIDVLISNAFIVTMDENRRIIERGFIGITNEQITHLGMMEDMPNISAQRHIDADGKAVFPGLINTHTHLFQTMLKGIGKDRNLMGWLEACIFPAQKNITPELIHLGSLLGCVDSLRSGTTTICDYQYTHGFLGMNEAVIDAMIQSGIRGVYGRGYSNSKELPEEYACENVDVEETFFLDTEELAIKYKNHETIDIAMAPGFNISMDNEGSFVKMQEICEKHDIVLTMHMNETLDDDLFSLNKYGVKNIALLERAGMLSDRLLAVHSVHLTEEELDLYKKYDVKVSHCPVANMILGSGVAPVPRMLEKGITVSLAVDGAASNDTQDMLETMKFAAMTHKQNQHDAAAISAEQVLEMATIGGARALRKEKEIGSLELGKKADLFIFNPNKSRSSVTYNPITSLIYSGGQSNIELTMVHGKIVLEDNKIMTLNEDELYTNAKIAGDQLIRHLGLKMIQWGQEFKF